MDRSHDMTSSSPARLIFGFFFPLLFGLLFQQVYNMVDTIVVGRFLGVKALAGVGSTGSLSFLVLGFCVGVCNGFAIPVAQKFGEHDYVGLRKFVANAIMLAIAVSIVMTTLICLLCRNVLVWMNTPEDIMEYAYGYIFVIFLGIPVVFLYNALFSIIRSLGDSRTPVLYLVFCSVLNVALDMTFIVLFKMGAEGAAWATVISQGVSSLLCINYIRHSPILVLTREDWHFEGECAKRLLGMGIPTGLQFSITAIGSIVLQTSVNTLGSVYVASAAAGLKINQFFGCPFDALGSTMVTYGGQNVGAGKLERIGKGLRSCLLIGLVYSAIAFCALFFFGKVLALLFVDAAEGVVIENAALFMKVNGIFYYLLAIVNIVRCLIQGLGFTKQAVFSGVFEMIARSCVGVLLVPAFGYMAVCVANPSAWLAADIFLFPTYFWAMRRLAREKRSIT